MRDRLAVDPVLRTGNRLVQMPDRVAVPLDMERKSFVECIPVRPYRRLGFRQLDDRTRLWTALLFQLCLNGPSGGNALATGLRYHEIRSIL
jgi:hypothetical protein